MENKFKHFEIKVKSNFDDHVDCFNHLDDDVTEMWAQCHNNCSDISKLASQTGDGVCDPFLTDDNKVIAHENIFTSFPSNESVDSDISVFKTKVVGVSSCEEEVQGSFLKWKKRGGEIGRKNVCV